MKLASAYGRGGIGLETINQQQSLGISERNTGMQKFEK
jgi:nitrogenase subunit NifH